MMDQENGDGEAVVHRSDNQCELSVKSLVASVGVVAISTMTGAKSKAGAGRKEVGLNIEFWHTLFG